jgi:transposase, IS30 family
MITENVQVFWAELQRGEFISDAAVAAGTYRKQGTRWVIANGGVRPRRGRGLKGRCLSFVEREQIGLSRAAGASVRAIAADLHCSPSTICRELRRNQEVAGGGGYRASSVHAMAYHRASRPKPGRPNGRSWTPRLTGVHPHTVGENKFRDNKPTQPP